MNDSPSTGNVTIHRRIDNESGIIVGIGDFAGLHAAYVDHAKLWGIAPDPLGEVMMKQALAGAALYLSCRPDDETVAWTLNIHRPPTNIFVTGSSASQSVTGRLFTQGVQPSTQSRLFVETPRPRMATQQSVIEVDGLDVLEIFETYSSQSDQSKARYLELEDGRYASAVALPGHNPDVWLDSISRTTLVERTGHFRDLDERVFWFQCGCDFDRMVEVVSSIYAGAIDDLFGDDPTVEIGCPRCGRSWRLGRDRFRPAD